MTERATSRAAFYLWMDHHCAWAFMSDPGKIELRAAQRVMHSNRTARSTHDLPQDVSSSVSAIRY
jgi:hypothetical protein